MKITLDSNNRKFITIEIELNGQKITLKYFEKNTKQIKQAKELAKKDNTKMVEIDELAEKQFFENLIGEEKDIDSLVEFYDEYGNIYEFMQMCEKELGKLKKKA